MEIIGEILLIILQFFAEILIQLVFEALAEIGLHGVKDVFHRPKPIHPALAAVGYGVLGAIAGGLSLLLVPHLVIDTHAGRLINLLVTPVAAGIVMAGLGAWRRRKSQELIRLDRFSYGFLFAFGMAVVRLAWGE